MNSFDVSGRITSYPKMRVIGDISKTLRHTKSTDTSFCTSKINCNSSSQDDSFREHLNNFNKQLD